MTLRDKLKFWILLCNYVEKVVSGTSPLTLDDAMADSLQYVKAFGGTAQRNLPAGYAELEYIESSGTQYIDTGIVPTLDYEFEIKAVKQQNRSLIGSGDDEFVLTGSSANNYAYIGSTATNLPNTIDSSVVHIWAIKNNKLYCDTTSADITKGASTPTVSLYLFARNESGTASNIGSHKIYYAKIWNESGVLVFNGVPAKREVDNAIGMYDTVSGSFFTNAGTGTFIAGPEVNPTLPAGYTRLNFIYMLDNSYVNTGIVPTYDGRVELDFQTTTVPAANAVFLGARTNTSDGSGISLATTSAKSVVMDTFGHRYTSGLLTNDTRYKYSYANSTSSLYSGNTLVVSDTSGGTDVVTVPMILNALNNNGTVYGNLAGIYVYSFRMWNAQGELIADYIPVTHSGAVCFYDAVSGNEILPTSGTFAGGSLWTAPTPTPSNPVDIWCNNGALRVDANGDVYTDGTVETINVLGKNLFNWHIGLKSLNDTTTVWQIVYGGVTMELNQSTGQFTVTGLSSGAGGRNSLRTQTFSLPAGTYTISATNNPTINILLVEETGGTTIAQTQDTTTFTLTETTPLHFGLGREQGTTYDDSFYLQIEQGSPATEYVPYNNSTATCEDLLSVGNYTDEQEIISGVVTRKVGVKVFDGTEEWERQGSANNVYTLPTAPYPADFASNPDNNVGFCTHFQVVARSTTISSYLTNGQMGWNQSGKIMFKHVASQADVANWKAFLAQQYAAGTPVIIVYPLATETTDTVTGQPMNTVQGDNTLEITQASLNNLEVEAKYKQYK